MKIVVKVTVPFSWKYKLRCVCCGRCSN